MSLIRRMMLSEVEGEIMEDLMLKRLADTMTEYSSDEVTSVIEYGFAYQKNLKSVSMPNCTNLKQGAFSYCTKLSVLNLPKLKGIANNVFRNCSSLTEFITTENFDSRLDISTFEGCSALSKADFYHISSLGISSYALACTNLTTLIIRNTDFIPTLNANAFGAATTAMNTGEGRVYVPNTMVDAYKENWQKYADQIFSIEELEG